jgi:hypothetical protein
LTRVAFDHLDVFPEKLGEPVPVTSLERLKHWRLFDDPFEPPLRRGTALPANQQIDPPNLREVREHVSEPYLPNETCDPNQEDILARECAAHRERSGVFGPIQNDQGLL